MRRRALPLALALASAGCVPVLVPPLRGELGGAIDGGHATRFALGAHSAGVMPGDGPALDVGAGWTGELADDEVVNQGGYVEVGVIGPRAPLRPSLGLRAALTSRASLTPSLTARLGVEASVRARTSRGGSRCLLGAATDGDAGLGVYVEAGRAWGDEDVWVATVGLFGRTPALAGVILLMPGC